MTVLVIDNKTKIIVLRRCLEYYKKGEYNMSLNKPIGVCGTIYQETLNFFSNNNMTEEFWEVKRLGAHRLVMSYFEEVVKNRPENAMIGLFWWDRSDIQSRILFIKRILFLLEQKQK